MSATARPQTARAVGNHFIELMLEDDDAPTPMQVVKLVYIAHGWNLAIHGRPLIDDRIEAWNYGPVIVDLYHGIKKFRGHPVWGRIGGGSRAVLKDFHEEDIRLADRVLAKYRDWSPFELSEMTHQKGTPWYTVWWDQGGKKSRSHLIPNDLIRNHFLALGARIREDSRTRSEAGGAS